MRIDNYIDRMNDLDDDAPPLPFPHTSQIEDELRELRPQIGGVRYRILYQRSGNLFVLLHALVKNTGAVETVRRLQSRAWTQPSASRRGRLVPMLRRPGRREIL